MFMWFPVAMVMQLAVAMFVRRIGRRGSAVGLHPESFLLRRGGSGFSRVVLMNSTILMGMRAAVLLFGPSAGGNAYADE